MSSDSRVLVVRIPAPRRHDNADTLSIVDLFDGGYPCIIRTGQYTEGQLAAYVPIDMQVPDTELFAFLRSKSAKPGSLTRIKAKRLRGVFSMGLLVDAPAGTTEGDDVTELLGCVKWEPEAEAERGPSRPGGKFLPGDAEPDPGLIPAYTDIENLRKWRKLLEGQEVVATEKVHGACSSFTYVAKGDDAARLWIRSRRQYKKPQGGGIWADVAAKYRFAEVLATVCPGVAISGEVYGQVQDLQYNVGGVDLVAFDAYNLSQRRYLDYDDFLKVVGDVNVELARLHRISLANAQQSESIEECWVAKSPPLACLRTAPLLYRGTYDYDKLAALAEGQTVLGGGAHVREGIVVKPVRESWHERLGRVILKLAGEGYLTR